MGDIGPLPDRLQVRLFRLQRLAEERTVFAKLTPLQKSTGGKQKLGAISKMGERTIRRLLIIGASAVVRWASQRGAAEG